MKRTQPRRISPKKLAANGGKYPYSTIPASSKKPRRKPRKPSETLRIYGPKGYVEWIHEQPCIACGVVGFSECAHIKTGGMGRKDDWTRTVPLCGPHWVAGGFGYGGAYEYFGCHRRLHAEGAESFGRCWLIDFKQASASTRKLWLEFSGAIK